MVGVGTLTSTPPEEATESPTTTTEINDVSPPTTPIDRETWTVAQIKTEAQPAWTQPLTVDVVPLGLYDLDGTLYLFGAQGTALIGQRQ